MRTMKLLVLSGRGLNDVVLVNPDQICTVTHDYVKTEAGSEKERWISDHGTIRRNHSTIGMASATVSVAESPEEIALLTRGWDPEDQRLQWLMTIEAEGGPSFDEAKTLINSNTVKADVERILANVTERCHRWCDTASDNARAVARGEQVSEPAPGNLAGAP